MISHAIILVHLSCETDDFIFDRISLFNKLFFKFFANFECVSDVVSLARGRKQTNKKSNEEIVSQPKRVNNDKRKMNYRTRICYISSPSTLCTEYVHNDYSRRTNSTKRMKSTKNSKRSQKNETYIIRLVLGISPDDEDNQISDEVKCQFFIFVVANGSATITRLCTTELWVSWDIACVNMCHLCFAAQATREKKILCVCANWLLALRHRTE